MANFLYLMCFLVMGWCLFMLYRNDWVYRVRMKAINQGLEIYDQLPRYEVMMRKFWIWDVKKFLKEGGNG